jgi:hypothetical protein
LVTVLSEELPAYVFREMFSSSFTSILREYYSTLKMEATVSKETIVKLKQNTWRHVPEGSNTETLLLDSNI